MKYTPPKFSQMHWNQSFIGSTHASEDFCFDMNPHCFEYRSFEQIQAYQDHVDPYFIDPYIYTRARLHVDPYTYDKIDVRPIRDQRPQKPDGK